MKKLLLTFGAATLALTGFASTRILYSQNFETAVDPAAAGWGEYRGLMSIVSDEYSRFLEINQNGQNGGSTYVQWGQEIFLKDGESVLEDGTYDVYFEYSIKDSNCNQYNSAITIFTNNTPASNQPYRNRWSPAGYWQNYLFDASQVDDGTTKDPLMYAVMGGTKTTENAGEDGTVTYSYSIDYSDAKTLETGVWYEVRLHVNVNTREVDYSMTSNTGETVQEGTYTVPETNIADGSEISMYAEGMNVMLARTNTIYDIDNIKISYESEFDIANDPVISLTRIGKDADDNIDLNLRAFTITFMEGEVLHLVGTDGTEETIDYDECEGVYEYETTKSGVLKAWTTCGDASSAVIEKEVECVPVALPAVEANISSVSDGYSKTYTLTVSNTDVELQPTIFIDYEFVGVSGEKIAEEGVASGVKVTVNEEGTLTMTSNAFGYQSTTVKVENNVTFEVKKTYDFARLTEDEIKAKGFPEFTVLNSSSQSGFNCWTGRNRLFYYSSTETVENVDDEGNVTTSPAKIYPFGFISEDNTTNVIKYTVINNVDKAGSEEAAPNVDNVKDEIFEGLTIFPKTSKNSPWKDPYAATEEEKQIPHYGTPNVGIIYRVGLFNDQTINNNNDVIIHDLDETDFVVVNYINNYGGNSNHPTVTTDEEYFEVLAGEDAVYTATAEKDAEGVPTGKFSVTYPLYRIDTALTKITIYKSNGDSAVESIEATVKGDNNWYSIDGVRVAEPTRPGLYIHNGKKVIVK